MKMYAEIKFNRPVNGNDFISPGSYTAITNDDKEITFDFMDFCGTIFNEDPTVVYCEMKNLDTETFPESKDLDIRKIKKFDEFFVDCDMDLHAVKVLNLELEKDGHNVSFSKRNVNKIPIKE